MTSPARLRELADLCEKAEGPDRNIDSQIHYVILNGVGTGYAGDAPAFTASLDAAVTLVPEGWAWHCASADKVQSSKPYACLAAPDVRGYEPWDEHRDVYESHAVTPILALCAAALQARARSHEDQS